MIAKCTRGILAVVLCVCCLPFLNGQTEVLRGYKCKLIPAGTQVDVNCDGISLVVAPHEIATVRECIAQPCFKAYYPDDVRVCQHTGNPADTCRGTLRQVTLKATHIGTCSRDCRCVRLRKLPEEITIKKWMWRCNV